MKTPFEFLQAAARLGAGIGIVAASLVLPGCAAGEDEDADDLDEPEEVALIAQGVSSGSCSIGGDKGKQFSFADGAYRVCWAKGLRGPAGTRTWHYTLRNNSSKGRRLKIDINNYTDTHCQFIGKGQLYAFTIDGHSGVPLTNTGQPQGVRGC